MNAASVPLWGWLAFGALVVVLLAVDLVTTRERHITSRRAALVWSIIWIGAGLLFNVAVWIFLGGRAAEEYLSAYLIEKSLSLDNLFMFLVIFQGLRIPKEHQHTVLTWGILGAVVFRGLFVFAGAFALERWAWVSYVFGALLLYAAYAALRQRAAEDQESKTIAWLSAHLPVTKENGGGAFFVVRQGKHMVTPLLVALLAIELTDILFALDSVPAALSMTRSRFLVYSSNIFAILGLRALYLLMAHTIAELRYLHYGLAGVLAFAAVKIIADPWVTIPPFVSVGIIGLMIGISIGASLRGAGRVSAVEAEAQQKAQPA